MELYDLFPLIYCINLDKRKDRWDDAQEEFEKVGIKPKRFSAIENNNSAYGCYLSHVKILEEAEKKRQNVLIFEDDIEFINYDKDFISSALEEMYYFPWWDMLYLGGNILKPFYQVSNYWAKLNHCQSTHAYGINKHFVSRLLEWLKKKSSILDVLYADNIVPFNNCYITVPMMAIQRTDYSDIEKREMTYDLPLQRYEHFLQKRKLNA
jgi:GR25 family glycosyltransferase involved in LPS biosynthesis